MSVARESCWPSHRSVGLRGKQNWLGGWHRRVGVGGSRSRSRRACLGFRRCSCTTHRLALRRVRLPTARSRIGMGHRRDRSVRVPIRARTMSTARIEHPALCIRRSTLCRILSCVLKCGGLERVSAHARLRLSDAMLGSEQIGGFGDCLSRPALERCSIGEECTRPRTRITRAAV